MQSWRLCSTARALLTSRFFAAEVHPRGWGFYFPIMSWEHT
jgi:hypothetical protein